MRGTLLDPRGSKINKDFYCKVAYSLVVKLGIRAKPRVKCVGVARTAHPWADLMWTVARSLLVCGPWVPRCLSLCLSSPQPSLWTQHRTAYGPVSLTHAPRPHLGSRHLPPDSCHHLSGTLPVSKRLPESSSYKPHVIVLLPRGGPPWLPLGQKMKPKLRLWVLLCCPRPGPPESWRCCGASAWPAGACRVS